VKLFRVVLLAAVLVACGDDGGPLLPGHEQPADRCVLAVVTSDYRSSSISLLAADGTTCNSDVLHSGSHEPGLVTALSGDIVLPTSASESREVVIIDRGNGVLTTLDVDRGVVTRQLSVVGTVGNPQDAIVDGDTLLVSQLQGDGADLVRLDRDGHLREAIDLAAAADPGFAPEPTRLARTGTTTWVGLAHLSPDFTSAAGPGRIVALEAGSREPIVIAIPGRVNCAHVAAAPDGSGVWVACTGFFQDGYAAQTARSGLAFVDRDHVVRWDPNQLLDAPVGFTLAPLDADRVLAVAIPADAGGKDRLVMIDRRVDTVTELLQADGFTIGAALVTHDHILVTIADRDDPRIERLDLRLGAESPIRSISKSGLEPRQIAHF